MNVKVQDLMAKRVITAEPHHTVHHVRGLMRRNRILAVPVVGPNKEPVGIITSSDLVDDLKAGSPISNLMTTDVFKVPAYNDVQVAARIMRKHRIHHVVVTHEQELVGIISSFDFLKLIQDNSFKAKGPTQARKTRARTPAQKPARKAARKAVGTVPDRRAPARPIRPN